MPLLATMISAFVVKFAELFAGQFAYHTALKAGLYTAYIAITTAFLATVYVCMNALYSSVSSFSGGSASITNLVGMFFMGLGMFIPSNAGACISCLSSVWIATQVYKMKKQGLFLIG